MEEKTLASEMLAEIKTASKRWFTIAMAELVIIIGMIIAFFVYESQYDYDNSDTIKSTDIDTNTGDNSDNNNIDISGITNG